MSGRTWCIAGRYSARNAISTPATWARVRTLSGWTLSVILSVIFLTAGALKLLGEGRPTQHFGQWGYPDGLRPAVGALEALSALLLVVPRTSWLGASGIIVVMLGATYTHLIRVEGEAGPALLTVGLLLLAGAAAHLRPR